MWCLPIIFACFWSIKPATVQLCNCQYGERTYVRPPVAGCFEFCLQVCVGVLWPLPRRWQNFCLCFRRHLRTALPPHTTTHAPSTMASLVSRFAARGISRRLSVHPSPLLLSQRWLSSYPEHTVVGMPSLSPVSMLGRGIGILCMYSKNAHVSLFSF
jgi:hypothetical protein